jgi:Ribonuclease G/E
MMSPKVLEADGLIFWFHSYDALHENRASVHAGKGSQNDHNDAKIWLEPVVEIARAGKTLKTQELNKAVKIIEQDLEYLLEEWHGYRNKANK